jgi:uncharacterized protein (TIGR03083 family)
MTDSTDPTQHFVTADAHVVAYRAVRDRVCEFVATADRHAACPLTPLWTVGDTLAHLVGVSTDILNGNIEGAASDEWTAAQVDARRERTIAELLDEWRANAEAFDAIVGAVPTTISGQVVADAVTHEHDLRHALGVFGAQDSDAVDIGSTWIAITAAPGKSSMTPAIRMVVGNREFVWGSGEPTTVSLRAFDLARIAAGRRSESQMRAAGFPTASLALGAPIFRPAQFDVVE